MFLWLHHARSCVSCQTVLLTILTLYITAYRSNSIEIISIHTIFIGREKIPFVERLFCRANKINFYIFVLRIIIEFGMNSQIQDLYLTNQYIDLSRISKHTQLTTLKMTKCVLHIHVYVLLISIRSILGCHIFVKNSILNIKNGPDSFDISVMKYFYRKDKCFVKRKHDNN